MFHFPRREKKQEEGKEGGREGKGRREGGRGEVNEQYMSVERAEGKKEGTPRLQV